MRRCRARGFTLTEFTVASVVAITLGTVVMQLYLATSEGLGAITAQGVTRMELAKALSAISRDAQEARRHWPSGGTCGLALPAEGQVILLLPRLDVDGNPTVAYDDMICYELCSGLPSSTAYCTAVGELWRHVDPQPGSFRAADHRLIAQGISTFSYPDDPFPFEKVFQLSLRASHTERGRTYFEPPSGPLRVDFSVRNWDSN